MTQSFKVELLHGLLEADRRHTLAELRDPTGHDEVMLAELGRVATPAECVSALVTALTLRIGDCERPTMDRMLQLTVGDRERLLLALAARLLGSELDLLTACPACRNLTEVPVRLQDVIAARPASDADRIELAADGGQWVARCRPPMGVDLERAVRGGPDAARRLIVDCLLDLIDPAGNKVAAEALPAECEAGVAGALAALDPAAECRIEIGCPSCGEKIEALIDGFTILQTGLRGAQGVYGDVYRMARAYHWSEAEILSLPLKRRRHYLAVAEGAEAGT